MQILLLLLKILGILLLVVMAILTLLIFAVLWIPVRYEANGHYTDGKPYLQAKISYAFPLLLLLVCFDEKRTAYLRVFGIKVKDFFAPPKTKTNKKDHRQKNRKEKKKQSQPIHQEKKTEDSETIVSVDHLEDTKILRVQDENHKTFFEKLSGRLVQAQNTVIVFCQKIKAFFAGLKQSRDDAARKKEVLLEYIELWKSPLYQKAFQKAKYTLLKLLKSIAPKKSRIFLEIGTNDPAVTGEICGFYGMLYPFIGKHVIMEPDFEKAVFEGSFLIKGRIYGFTLLKAVVICLFHKDLKCIRQLVMKR